MALLIVYIHSYFEWIFITFPAQYMFALDAGMVAGLATQLGYWRLSQEVVDWASVGAVRRCEVELNYSDSSTGCRARTTRMKHNSQ